ncbi:subclass B3 metallo-beta-lactamase [Novosphingobium fuchskuhlense]|uniref:subclass B3 metallo-beta-lactamase n=1 Tax=Novosphingobium fuchskuhlense TaxID=1117702 RepID=UPI000A826F3B|nr:subclass B3 metallo-beta-lactamase [Novosphingobium fuchskuhlense]
MSARALAALALALAPAVVHARPASAGPDRAATQALVKQCGDTEDFSAPAPPARLYGNTFYVGTCTVSVLLVTSPQGHVLVDSATDQAVPAILANIRALGFRPEDIRWIVSSHEHFDHVGGLAALQKATGARVALSAPAARIAQTGAPDPADSQFGVLKDHPFAPVKTDRIVTPGSVIRVGPVRLVMSATPGHTTGSTSWSWQSCADKRCRTVSYVDSISALAAPPYRFTDHPEVVARFRRTFAAIAARRCGILVTPHPSVSNLFERMQGQEPLAPQDACRAYAAKGRKGLDAQLAKETAK